MEILAYTYAQILPVAAVSTPRAWRSSQWLTWPSLGLLLVSVSVCASTLPAIAANRQVSTPHGGCLNIRSGPGMEYGIVRCVASGTALSVTRAQGSWVQLASGNWTFGPYTLPTTGDQGGIGGRLLCPGLNGLPILDLGSRGASVVAVQKSLQQLGYNTGNTGADGVYGPLTKAAVQRFQKDYGLLADGRVGPATWNALGKAIGGSLPMPPINGGTVTPPPINGGGEVATGDRVTLNAVDANAEVIASATVRNGPAPDSEVTGEVLTPGMTVTILETLNGSYRLKGNSELLWVPMTTLQRF